MARVGSNRLYGTLELLVLKTIDADGPLHGLDVARAIRASSGESLRIEEGALYPALHRLETRGLVQGQWRRSDNGRRAKFYEITGAGRSELQTELRSWIDHTSAVRQVLDVPRGKLK